MARSMEMDPDAPVYRSVITYLIPWSGLMKTICEGPYATDGAAQSRVTKWVNDCRTFDDEGNCTGSTASGYVEVGAVTWTRSGKS